MDWEKNSHYTSLLVIFLSDNLFLVLDEPLDFHQVETRID